MAMSNGQNFYEAFAVHLRSDPSAPCLVLETGEILDRMWLDQTSARYAAVLSDLGCVPGDRIAVQVDKSPHALGLYLGCIRAGLCFIPLNTAYKQDELSYLLSNAEPQVLVCRPNHMASAELQKYVPYLLTLGDDGRGTLADKPESAQARCNTVGRSGEDIAALLYTSGTTGRPKGATISHRAMWSCARTLGDVWNVRKDDILLHTLPLFHGHGLFVSSNVILASGGRIILHKKFDTKEVISALPSATIFMGVPTYYHRLLADKSFDRSHCEHIRLFTCGSAPLSAEIHKEFEQRTQHKIVERYGATETMIVSSNPLEGDRRPGSVGLPLPGVDLRIADSEDRALPKGEIGMIEVRSPGLFSGYWRIPDQTDQDFTVDGFFRTGDLGRVEEDGYLTITGRVKDLIISGGYNVYPSEVEAVLVTHPTIREAAVIGVPHSDFGEAVVAIVVASDSKRPPNCNEIIALAKSKLANFKVPQRVITVDDFPRNTMGKIQKNLLRDSYRKLFSEVVPTRV